MFNIITTEQPSVDPYRFYNRVLWTSFKLPENSSIYSMLTKNKKCCSMIILLLNNHIKKLIAVNSHIINTAKCITHALSEQCKIQCKIIAKWVK